jgi:HPt (histidine-containing phosphotransfer) domain-containing protein
MSDDAPILDPAALDRLLEMTGGDPAFVDELVQTFLDDAAAQLGELRAAADAGSVDGIVRPAHSLKSNSASVGAMRLSELARSLEADARGGQVGDGPARVRAMEAAFEAVRPRLMEGRSTS